MGLVLLGIMPLLRRLLPASGTSKLEAVLLLAIGIAVGGVVYLAVARLVRSEEVSQAANILLRRFRRSSS